MIFLRAGDAVCAIAAVETEDALLAVLTMLGKEHFKTALQIGPLITAFALFHIQAVHDIFAV